MPQSKTIDRLVAFLKQLQKTIKEQSSINLSEVLRTNRLPADYGKLMLKEGLIIKVDSGRRGPSNYVWNDVRDANEEVANKLITAYNKMRNYEQLKRDMAGKTATKRPSTTSRLITIEGLLRKILTKLK